MRTRRYLLSLVLAFAACGDADSLEPSYVGTLTLLNRAFIELLELRVHSGADYAAAPNLLPAPLAVDASFVIDPFSDGERVTVIRRPNSVADPIAITTAEDLPVGADGYTLVVYDEDFVLMQPGAAP